MTYGYHCMIWANGIPPHVPSVVEEPRKEFRSASFSVAPPGAVAEGPVRKTSIAAPTGSYIGRSPIAAAAVLFPRSTSCTRACALELPTTKSPYIMY
jgi:hypothetical protein